MKRIGIAILSLSLLGCIPLVRTYENGKLVSKRYRVSAPADIGQKEYQGFQSVFLLGLEKSEKLKEAKGYEVPTKLDSLPVAIEQYCKTGTGTIVTKGIIAHTFLIPIAPLIWVPVHTQIYCSSGKTSKNVNVSKKTENTKNTGKQPSKTREEKAIESFEEAETHYRLLQYEEALSDYQKAYTYSPKPEILFNIAQCYRQLKRYQEALDTYEAFLRDDPDTSLRKRVEGLMGEMQEKLGD